VVPTALSCEGQESWQHGNSLVNYMKWLEMEGLTGRIRFDSLGRRTDFELEIVELKKSGLEKVHINLGFYFSGGGCHLKYCTIGHILRV
jgi:hypothetical protein